MAHEFDGDRYEQASTHQKLWGDRLIASLELDGHERVLDLGCGDGVLAERLADLVPRGHVVGVHAIDRVVEVVKAALVHLGRDLAGD